MLTGRLIIAVTALATVLTSACASATPTPAPTAAPKPTAAPSAATPASPAAKPAATTAPAAKPAAKSSELDGLIEGARKEGVVTARFVPALGQKGAQRLIDAFNQKYNIGLKLDYTPDSNSQATVSQMLMEVKTGVPPSADIIFSTQTNLYAIAEPKALIPYDWPATFPDMPRDTMKMDNMFFTFAAAHLLPVYNTNLVKPEDVPKKWDDLLSTKWTGKAIAHNVAGPWVELTAALGEDKVTALVEGMAKQKPALVPIPQITTRVGSGEFPIGFSTDARMIMQAEEAGAPLRGADQVKPLIGQIMGLAIPKGAQHSNAAKLFIGFQLTPEAQKIWWEEAKWGSPFVQGPMADWAKGKEISYANIEFLMKEGRRLDEKYRKILGMP